MKEVEDEWNEKRVNKGLRSRSRMMAKAKCGTKAALWAGRKVGKEDRRAVLKLLIGKLAMRRHGVRQW